MYVYKFEAFLSKEECVQDPDPTELDTQSHIFSITQHYSEEKKTLFEIPKPDLTKLQRFLNAYKLFFRCLKYVKP